MLEHKTGQRARRHMSNETQASSLQTKETSSQQKGKVSDSNANKADSSRLSSCMQCSKGQTIRALAEAAMQLFRAST
jgi:hypothetical protein